MKDTLREADEALAASLRASETDASLSIFGAAATRRRYLDARDAFTAERTPRELNDYATIVRNKMKTIGATLDGYAKIFAYNQERIDLYGGTVSGDVFADSTFDYEICFVAGTPVVMADGRVRSIETLRPGDEVLAADHLQPESGSRAARVVRFFDNGEKPVVRLRFDGFELVCTPEHPFYIVGKGWTRASELTVGDLALSASGERVAFLGREAVDGARRVYNIEVEGAHTYFVGDGGGVLAHNKCNPSCPLCHGSGVIVSHAVVSSTYPPAVSECFCVINDVPQGFTERLRLVNTSRNPIDFVFDNIKDYYALLLYPQEGELDNVTVDKLTTLRLFQLFLSGKGNCYLDEDAESIIFTEGDLVNELKQTTYINSLRKEILQQVREDPDKFKVLNTFSPDRILYKNDLVGAFLDLCGGANATVTNQYDYSISLFLGSYQCDMEAILKGEVLELSFNVVNTVSYESFRRSIWGKTYVNSFSNGYMGNLILQFKWKEQIFISDEPSFFSIFWDELWK